MDKRVVVTGDVALDVNIYLGKRTRSWSPVGAGTRTAKAPGGAFLLHRLVAAAAASAQGPDGRPPFEACLGLPESLVDTMSDRLHAYSLWEGTPGPPRKRPDGRDAGTTVWRLSRSLGYGGAQAAAGAFAETPAPVLESPHVLVLDDCNLGFRLLSSRALWPDSILGGAATPPRWIVLKMADPLCEGDLWRSCQLQNGSRCVAVVNIEDIRREEVRVTCGVSWERTAQDLVGELERNPALSSLKAVRFLVVRIGLEGALVVRRDPGVAPEHTLVFDPAQMEGDWSARIGGGAVGYMSTLTAAIAARLAQDDGDGAIRDGVISGLSAMRALLVEGHTEAGVGMAPGFPFQAVAAAMVDEKARSSFASVSVPVPPTGRGTDWAILASAGAAESTRPLFGPARRLALMGPATLKGFPYQRFGHLLTMDRSEIESLRNLRQLIRDYVEGSKGKKPLSVAVFGPPGSGKSFGIKQIAQGILGPKVPLPEFNLSQFKDPQDLIGALHQVRDMVLKGTTPVVFWDEFDSKGYLWLQYLLAPMQDGAFQEGQVTHPIGKCVFVFAGATSWDFENFGPAEEDEAEWKNFKLLKGPDFISRLSGYLNVLGPNPRCAWDREKKKWVLQDEDVCFPVRRAILLRAMRGLKDDQRLEIDPGLLSAFLEIPQYKHGARSLEKILEQVEERGKRGVLRRSDLPPAAILDLHADYGAFMTIAERDLGFASCAQDLAPAIHGFYSAHLREVGARSRLAEEFEKLAPATKADNIAAARRIPAILGLVGLTLVREGDAPEMREGMVEGILAQNMEMLAEAEHDGWMDYRLRNGWEYREVRNDELRQHPLLVRYRDLSHEEKDKDRSAVRSYPAIAALAGYRIVDNMSER